MPITPRRAPRVICRIDLYEIKAPLRGACLRAALRAVLGRLSAIVVETDVVHNEPTVRKVSGEVDPTTLIRGLSVVDLHVRRGHKISGDTR